MPLGRSPLVGGCRLPSPPWDASPLAPQRVSSSQRPPPPLARPRPRHRPQPPAAAYRLKIPERVRATASQRSAHTRRPRAPLLVRERPRRAAAGGGAPGGGAPGGGASRSRAVKPVARAPLPANAGGLSEVLSERPASASAPTAAAVPLRVCGCLRAVLEAPEQWERRPPNPEPRFQSSFPFVRSLSSSPRGLQFPSAAGRGAARGRGRFLP